MTIKVEVLVAVWIPEKWLQCAVGRYERYAAKTTRLHGTTLSPDRDLPTSCANPLEKLVSNARAAEAAGYNACIIDCFGDPGLDACGSAVRIPVVGVGQAGMQYAFATSETFSVVTTEASVVEEIWRNAKRYGVASRLADVESIEISAAQIPDQRDEALERTLQTIQRFASLTQTVLLGCTELAGLIDEVRGSRELPPGIRVIDPIGAAVRHAESLVLLDSWSTGPNGGGQ